MDDRCLNCGQPLGVYEAADRAAFCSPECRHEWHTPPAHPTDALLVSTIRALLLVAAVGIAAAASMSPFGEGLFLGLAAAVLVFVALGWVR